MTEQIEVKSVPRVEPSGWKSLDILDLKIVRRLYTEECLDAIIAHLGELSSADEKRKTQNEIITIAQALHNRFNQSVIPTIAQQCAALKLLLDGLNDTLDRWCAFDLRSKERIEDVANNEPQQNHEDQYSGGRERVARSIRTMEDLWRWTQITLEIANEENKKEPISLKKRGRPEERAALEDLEKIWLLSQAQKKTARSFREFAKAALGPVLRENKRNESLESLVRSNPFKRKNANMGT